MTNKKFIQEIDDNLDKLIRMAIFIREAAKTDVSEDQEADFSWRMMLIDRAIVRLVDQYGHEDTAYILMNNYLKHAKLPFPGPCPELKHHDYVDMPAARLFNNCDEAFITFSNLLKLSLNS